MSDENYHHGNLREELISAAIHVLSTKGVQALSLRALARELGVSHGAPTRHFASKADLLQAIAEEGVMSLIAMARAAVTAGHAKARLLQMAMAYVAWARQNPAFHLVLRNPEVLRYGSTKLTDALNQYADLQRAEIKKAQSEGWRVIDDAETLLLHLMSLTAGSALVVTDPAYESLLGARVAKEAVTASLKMFLGA